MFIEFFGERIQRGSQFVASSQYGRNKSDTGKDHFKWNAEHTRGGVRLSRSGLLIERRSEGG